MAIVSPRSGVSLSLAHLCTRLWMEKLSLSFRRDASENAKSTERWSSMLMSDMIQSQRMISQALKNSRIAEERKLASILSFDRKAHISSSSAAWGSSFSMAEKEISHVLTIVFSPYCHTADAGFLPSVFLKLASKRGKKASRGFCCRYRNAPA